MEVHVYVPAFVRALTIKEIHTWLVQDMARTVQRIALLGLIFCAVGTTVAPHLRVTMEFCLLGICFVSALVLLTNSLQQEAGTAIWFGSIVSMMIASHLTDPVSRVLMMIFVFVCLWLMWYVSPYPKVE